MPEMKSRGRSIDLIQNFCRVAIGTVLTDAELTELEHRQPQPHAVKQGMMQELITERVRLI